MRTYFASSALLLALTLGTQAHLNAQTRTAKASMLVTATVLETCQASLNPGGAVRNSPAATVTCNHAAPYSVSVNPRRPAGSAQSSRERSIPSPVLVEYSPWPYAATGLPAGAGERSDVVLVTVTY